MDSDSEVARARAVVALKQANLDSLGAAAPAPERLVAEARLNVALAALDVAEAVHESELAADTVAAAAAALESAERALQLAVADVPAAEDGGNGDAGEKARTALAQRRLEHVERQRAFEARKLELEERRRELGDRRRELGDRRSELADRQRALEERQNRDLGSASPPPAPRELISSPSQRVRSQIQHKLLKRWMPTAQIVAAMVELHSPRARDDAAVRDWQRLVTWIEKGPPEGAFSRTEFFSSQSDEHRKQVAMVSQVALYLEKRLRDRQRGRDSGIGSTPVWINELSTAKSNRLDLALLAVEDSGIANVRVVVDGVVGSSSMNKEAPIDAYVYEVASTSLPDHRPYYMLGIALGLPRNGAMEASVWAFSGFNDKRQEDQHRSLLFSGTGGCSAGELMARLEAAACAFAEAEPEDALVQFENEAHIFRTANGMLRKVVFNPERLEQWRDVTEAAERLYEKRGGAVCRLRDRRPLFVEYPFCKGQHLPGTAAETASAARALAELHAVGFIHGDIRLSNIIFSGSGAAHLIDFDLAGTVGSPYVSNYNTEVADGVRAAGADSGRRMEFDHDWEALAGTFSKCLKPPEDQRSAWEAALGLLRSGNFSGLDALGPLPLEPTAAARELFGEPATRARGTASPASLGSPVTGEPPSKRLRTET
ncbi:hypothetical protein DFJ74DRAFT_518624 [Hyaloraphidium curvatum]|nr:hypothetical protein DFJ74DRAFT_518624 [Hyaloraphidium curvatum]